MHPGIGGIPLSKALQSVAASTGSITIDQRFVALLDADSEGLFEHLRHAILLVRAHQIRVDWNDLLIAMFGWNREDRVIQRLWARAYWGNEEGEEDAQP
jgi:CRISPR system Cascade subunit CasB